MPEVAGYALLRKVRALAPGKGGRTPCSARTAYARKEEVQRAFAAGFGMHLPKPTEPLLSMPGCALLIRDHSGKTKPSKFELKSAHFVAAISWSASLGFRMPVSHFEDSW
jgi:CheY-like chemotaxis protein